jgi:serine/threonine-protein kinase RsbW
MIAFQLALHTSIHQRPVTSSGQECWRQDFPGVADQVGEARRFPARHLDGLSLAEDAVLCMSELAANAVIHSNSRLPGGSFTVQVSRSHAGRYRIEVIDQGGPWKQDSDPDEQHGRGLMIVTSLATSWGIAGGQHSRSAWFELGCP